MRREDYEVRDGDPTTDGGPPPWMAFAAVFVVFLFAAAAFAFVLSLFTDFGG